MTTPGTPTPPPNHNELMEVYKTIFDTWRSQVDSSWQRSSYFAAFEIAAIGGCWLLVSGDRRLPIEAGIGFSVGGFLLTVIWAVSTSKMHEYVRHWWDSIQKIEAALALSPHDYAEQLEFKREQARSILPYKLLVVSIPFVFSLVWVALFVIAVVRLTCFMRLTCL